MADDGVERFLRAEEEANRLVEELKHLKEETESYQTARKALGEVAQGVAGLATRLSDISGRLGDVVETLRSIGTPELLRGQEAVTREVAMLRQDLGGTQQSILEALTQAMDQVRILCETLESAERTRQEALQRLQQRIGELAAAESITDLQEVLEQREEAHRQEIQALKEDLSAQHANIKAVVDTVRNLALGSIGLLVIALALLVWLAL